MNKLSMLIILAVVLCMAGCCGGGASDSVKLVPAGVDLMVDINIKSLLNDSNVTDNIIDPVTKKKMTVDEAFKQAKEKTGIDFSKLEKVQIFVDFPMDAIASGEKPDPTKLVAGAILTGTFSKDDIIAVVKKKTGTDPKPVTIDGQEVYESPDKKAQITLIGSKYAVIGTGPTVGKVIGLNAGKGEAVGAEMTDVMASAPSDSYVKLAILLPAELKEMILKKAPPQAQLLEKVNNLMLTYRKISASNYGLSLTAKTVDEEAAKKITTALEGLMGLGKMMAMQKPDLAKLMETLKIESTGNIVKITVEIDPELMKKAAKGIPMGK
ncbi:hypothetical protein KAJ27_09525 [bacterium]|nr:hypothetical protein [bacterium]